jgi:Secretion system C-terminal sorting domain
MKFNLTFTPTWKNRMSIALVLCLGLFSTQHALAQCNNGSPFGTATAPTNNTPVTITTCAFGGEFSTINSAVAGTTYLFNATGGVGNFITIRQGTSGGTVLGFGFAPISVVCTVSGPLFLHYNTNAACGTDNSCHNGTVQCTSCAGAPDPCLSITPIACATSTTATLSGTGLWNVTTCGFSTPGTEKLYSFTPTTTGVHNLQVTSTNSGGFIDYFIKAASGGCSSTGWTCIDDIFSSPTTATMGTLTAGTTYYILLDPETSASVTHTFQINCPVPVAPANDLCANAIPIACGGTASGSTTMANNDGPATDCAGGSTAPDVWYTITGTGGAITASLCGSTYDTQIDVYTGACGTLTNIGGCSDDFCGTASQMTWTSTLGTVYRIRVHGFAGATGAYLLAVSCGPVGPVNDACANALPIACGGSFSGNTGTATIDGPATDCGGGSVAPDVWYTITGTGGAITASLCGSTYDTQIDVYTGACGALTNIGGCNDDFCGTQSQMTWTSTFGTVYRIRVHGFAGATGAYIIVISCASSLPPNGAATVACPALAVAPSPLPVVFDTECGGPITPTLVITNVPNPLTCEGTRTYTYTYTGCAGVEGIWSFVYTVERNPFTVPVNTAAQVACPALIVQPIPPVVLSNCGETITPTGPVITNAPNPLTCEGTRTFTWTYTDCEGNTLPWSHVVTVERNPFFVPVNGSVTVACPALATQPVPPVVLSNCAENIVPTGPVITNVPNPLTCEGTRTYTWTYTDCEGNTLPWSFIYTIERNDFAVPVNGAALVACPDQTDVAPVPPVVLSNCGEVLTPVLSIGAKPICEGTRTYTYTYTDCEGNTHDWKFIYTVEYLDFIIPTSIVGAVECPVNAFEPTPVAVNDNCGNPLTPVGPTVTSTTNAQGCEASRKYEWIYTDCEGNSHAWSQTFLFEYNGDFFAPLDEENYVTCLAYAVQPVPQTLYDYCGLPIAAKLVGVTQDIASSGCTGWRKYSFVYTDCGGHSHPWNFTYYINDNEGPLGTCPSGGSVGGPVSVSVRNLSCIEDVPCPADYDFLPKVEELLEAGNYFDVCDGDNVIVTLDSWSDLWECSDPDGDGVYTFGRTFYFRIADHCGNEYASLCEVTYAGNCQPLESFRSSDWGIAGGAPGTSVSAATTDLQVISTLLGTNPILIGGGSRSLRVSEAQCVVDLLPGMGGPGILANCHQVNCTNGCNPMGVGGMKNALAANALALTLNMRYNVQYKGLTMANVRNQSLGCITLHPCIYACNANGDNCYLRIFDQQGQELQYDYTVGGLLDLTNYFLGGSVNMSVGQSVIYSTGLNQSLMSVNEYWSEGQVAPACDAGAGIAPSSDDNKANPTAIPNPKAMLDFSLAPNPASNEVTFKLAELQEPQEVVFEVYNALGQQLLRKDFGMVNFVNERIDLGGIGNGVYFVNVKAGGQRYEQKLVIGKD